MQNVSDMTHKQLVEQIQLPVDKRDTFRMTTAEAKRAYEAKSVASSITEHMFDGLSPVNFRILRTFVEFPGKGLTINNAAYWCRCSTSAVPKRMSELRAHIEPYGYTISKVMTKDSRGCAYGEYFLAKLAD